MAILPSLYDHHADDYERLVRYEDYEGNLLRAITAIRPLSGAQVVDMGAGTGRVTRLLMPHVARIDAFDLSHGMLRVAADQVRREREGSEASVPRPVTLAQADSRALPLPDGCADLAVEGWSFAHIAAWNRETWQADVTRAIREMLRILIPGGTAILIETLGTGRADPHPPADWFAELYAWFAQERGFESTWIRTDYRFPSQDEAARLMGFFFGEASAESIMAAAEIAPDGACIVPECTGLWWRKKPA